jgi:oxaloacetate decarboxylase gamma subunit
MEPSLTDLLLPGVKLMAIGMAIVFLFLALLVWIIGITARLVSVFNPQTQEIRRSSLSVETEEAELVAVIAALLEKKRT